MSTSGVCATFQCLHIWKMSFSRDVRLNEGRSYTVSECFEDPYRRKLYRSSSMSLGLSDELESAGLREVRWRRKAPKYNQTTCLNVDSLPDCSNTSNKEVGMTCLSMRRQFSMVGLFSLPLTPESS